jgi:hypothetical protein
LNSFSSAFEIILKSSFVIFLANSFLKKFSRVAQNQCAIINTACSFAPSLSLDQASRKLLLQEKPDEPFPPKRLACLHGSLSSLQMTG